MLKTQKKAKNTEKGVDNSALGRYNMNTLERGSASNRIENLEKKFLKNFKKGIDKAETK